MRAGPGTNFSSLLNATLGQAFNWDVVQQHEGNTR